MRDSRELPGLRAVRLGPRPQDGARVGGGRSRERVVSSISSMNGIIDVLVRLFEYLV
jgi:hypothetical protein